MEETTRKTGVDGRTILEWILGKWGGKVWTECIWLRIGIGGVSYSFCNMHTSCYVDFFVR
jgi:hypothetical protein